MTSTEEFQYHLNKIAKTLDIHSVSRNDIVELLLAISFNNKYDVIPNSTHLKLVKLFCQSSGLIQEIIHKFRHLPLAESINSITLQSEYISLSASDFTNIMIDLKNTGYATLPERLHESVCRRILEFANSQEYSCVAHVRCRDICYDIQTVDEMRPNTLSAYMKESCINGSDLINKIIEKNIGKNSQNR